MKNQYIFLDFIDVVCRTKKEIYAALKILVACLVAAVSINTEITTAGAGFVASIVILRLATYATLIVFIAVIENVWDIIGGPPWIGTYVLIPFIPPEIYLVYKLSFAGYIALPLQWMLGCFVFFSCVAIILGASVHSVVVLLEYLTTHIHSREHVLK